jgi:ABC-type transporter Mla subunit MlaD
MAAPVVVLAQQGIGIPRISVPLELEETGTDTPSETPNAMGTPSGTSTETSTETPTATVEPPTEAPLPTDTPAPAGLDQVRALIDQVNSLAASGDIDGHMVNSLLSQLQAALASLERGNLNSARGQLGGFIHHVEAQRGKKISEAAAAELIAQAEAILGGG